MSDDTFANPDEIREKTSAGKTLGDVDGSTLRAENPPDFTGTHIRIASRPVTHGKIAPSVEEAVAAVHVPWIEIDGHRFNSIRDVQISAGNRATVVTVEFLAVPEFVYVDVDDDPVPLIREDV